MHAQAQPSLCLLTGNMSHSSFVAVQLGTVCPLVEIYVYWEVPVFREKESASTSLFYISGNFVLVMVTIPSLSKMVLIRSRMMFSILGSSIAAGVHIMAATVGF